MAMDLNKLRAKKGMPIPEERQEKERVADRTEIPMTKAELLQEKPKAKKERKTPEQRDQQVEKKGRLPDRSRFDVQWDATAKKWSGSLVIETATGPKVFSGKNSGVFLLLHKLDDQYREWVARNTGEAVAG